MCIGIPPSREKDAWRAIGLLHISRLVMAYGLMMHGGMESIEFYASTSPPWQLCFRYDLFRRHGNGNAHSHSHTRCGLWIRWRSENIEHFVSCWRWTEKSIWTTTFHFSQIELIWGANPIRRSENSRAASTERMLIEFDRPISFTLSAFNGISFVWIWIIHSV